MDPEILKKIIQILRDEDKDAAIKLLEEMAVGTPSDGAPADPTAASADPPNPEQEAMSALSRDVVVKLGAKNAGEASARFAEILSAHAETEKRARDLEASERRGLVADLVKIGAETPATAWQNVDAEGDARSPVKRLADEPIDELRSRVKALTAAARPATRSRSAVIVESEGDRVVKTSKGDVTVSAREIKNCEEKGVKVETYALNKAVRESARRGRK
jgi:hypothetical protein